MADVINPGNKRDKWTLKVSDLLNDMNCKFDYDEDEKVIGTWFGKPLYQKTYSILANSDTISSTLFSDLNIEKLISGHFLINDAHVFEQLFIKYQSVTKEITNIPSDKWIDSITIQYTKTTDM